MFSILQPTASSFGQTGRNFILHFLCQVNQLENLVLAHQKITTTHLRMILFNHKNNVFPIRYRKNKQAIQYLLKNLVWNKRHKFVLILLRKKLIKILQSHSLQQSHLLDKLVVIPLYIFYVRQISWRIWSQHIIIGHFFARQSQLDLLKVK